MQRAIFVLAAVAMIASPTPAVEFLGVELCAGSIDTRVELPTGSHLVVESVEIGDQGGLVMLLSATTGKVMDNVDDLMVGITGVRGAGDEDALEWTGDRLTAVAQRVAKKYVALAVTSADPCPGGVPGPASAAEISPATPGVAVPPEAAAEPMAKAPEPEPAAIAAAAMSAAPVPPAPPAEPAVATPTDFEVVGAVSHEAADSTWVDVMGVVANHTATGYRLATFDVSLYDASGSLICVDTISVSVLKAGQQRAFRDAVRCPGYAAGAVARVDLEFAGGF
jgi:hypothetical protein